jgi:heat shock protein HtpX
VWEQIRSNRRRSAAVIAVMGVVLVATGAAIAVFLAGGDPSVDPRGVALTGGSVALALWAVLWMVSVTSGDRIMLSLSGAREIEKQDHPQLFNVVEEMTIAAALGTRPRVFVVDDPSPNAFAVGRRPETAAVAVTTGLLRLLDRDELQGVVAHEIGHIRNRDTALMATAGVMLGVVVLLADLGVRSLWFGGGRRSRASSRDDRDGGGILVLLALVFMVVAPLLAQALYFALSRRREYLADASGALFTRYPEGLASALEKLGGSDVPLANQSRVTAPMYTVPPRRTGLFDTHPPIAERVRILRSMAGGAGLGAYEAAYRQVTNGSVVGARTLAAAEDVPARAPAPAGPERAERARQASDALLSAAGYRRVTCRCGAVLKVPPALAGKVAACPRCGAPIAA